ncbi:MAG: hypothetical protein HKN13_14695 [Rhodothermales bacterium]|nr:hypothetical protein [Rhodothermales bacterium]
MHITIVVIDSDISDHVCLKFEFGPARREMDELVGPVRDSISAFQHFIDVT